MQDKLKESISALIDEELSEIEMHRLLRQYAEDSSVKKSWLSYRQIQAVMQDEPVLTTAQHCQLHDSISAAIEAEEDLAGSAMPVSTNPALTGFKANTWYRPTAGLAVAASLVVAVLIGFNALNPNLDTVGPNIAEATKNVQPPTAVKPVVQFAASDVQFDQEQPELRELDAESQARLRKYLLQHERMSRMNSNVQTVSFKSGVVRDSGSKSGPGSQ
ncbi:MAG: sigma-E factor negative regulatory protein [Pseudomonadales bacterium]|nr:sigma-E factor negative regulatory protein [Pseudomonadales bacterium]